MRKYDFFLYLFQEVNEINLLKQVQEILIDNFFKILLESLFKFLNIFTI